MIRIVQALNGGFPSKRPGTGVSYDSTELPDSIPRKSRPHLPPEVTDESQGSTQNLFKSASRSIYLVLGQPQGVSLGVADLKRRFQPWSSCAETLPTTVRLLSRPARSGSSSAPRPCPCARWSHASRPSGTMTDQQLEAKFLDLADGILPQARRESSCTPAGRRINW